MKRKDIQVSPEDKSLWAYGKKVKVLNDESFHCIPIGTVVKVVDIETDGTIMLAYKEKPCWAAPSDLGVPFQ